MFLSVVKEMQAQGDWGGFQKNRRFLTQTNQVIHFFSKIMGVVRDNTDQVLLQKITFYIEKQVLVI